MNGAQTHAATYRCFGLTVRSDIPIAELRPEAATGSADVTVSRAVIDRVMPAFPVARTFTRGAEQDYLGIAMVGQYLIGPTAIVFDQAPDLPDDFVGFSFLGPVMAALMHRRGHLVLHGSALMIGGRTVVFLGDKGAGKSTTAGAFVAAGHRLVSDDIIAIPGGGAPPVVQPAFPLLKLSPAALQAFGDHHFLRVPNPTAYDVKHRLIPRDGVPDTAVPLAAIYQLVRGTTDAAPRATPLDVPGRLALLVEHSYMARYGNEAFREPGELAAHLAACGRLVREVRIARLDVPPDIARLGETVARVEADIRALDDGAA